MPPLLLPNVSITSLLHVAQTKFVFIVGAISLDYLWCQALAALTKYGQNLQFYP